MKIRPKKEASQLVTNCNQLFEKRLIVNEQKNTIFFFNLILFKAFANAVKIFVLLLEQQNR